jgi:hypothetical protein
MPLFPLRSYYCLDGSFSGSQKFRIPLNLESVLVAYLRWWVSIPSITLLAIAFALEQLVYGILGILGFAIVLTTFLLGGLTKKEAKQRQILVRVVGMGADPGILPPDMVQSILAKLEEKWGQSNSISQYENWRNIRSPGAVEKNLLPLLYSLAVYGNEIELSERVWEALERMLED